MKEKLKCLISCMCIEKKIIKMYRKSYKCFKKGRKKMAYYLYYKMQKKYQCILSPQAKIGNNFYMPHPFDIAIGKDVIIGDNATIYHDVTIGQNNEKSPVIGDNVIVYAGAKIFGDIKIGDNVIVGANAVVTHSIPSNSVVAGIPAKIIKVRDSK